MTTKTITFAGKTYAQPGALRANPQNTFLEDLSGPELVSLFRLVKSNLGEEVRTTRFPDSKTVIKRTWAALEQYDQSGPADEPKGKVELSAADKKQIADEAADRKATPAPEPSDKKARKPRGMRFVFPAGDEIKPVRAGTFRAKLVELFSQKPGATFDEALAATWGSKEGMDPETAKKTCYEGIRLLHYYVGYGMKQDADGRITIHK